jgi:hypothetical protein
MVRFSRSHLDKPDDRELTARLYLRLRYLQHTVAI